MNPNLTNEQLLSLLGEFQAPYSIEHIIKNRSIIGEWLLPILIELRDRRRASQREMSPEEFEWREK